MNTNDYTIRVNKLDRRRKSGNVVADKHQLKILKDTVRNPTKALMGGPTETEAVRVLKERFGYTDKQLDILRK